MNRLALLLATAWLACNPVPSPVPPPAPDATDATAPTTQDAAPSPPQPQPIEAGPAPFPSTPCGDACALLEVLSCPEAKPTAAGKTCDQVCEQSNSVPGAGLPVACVLKATGLDAVRKCGVRCSR